MNLPDFPKFDIPDLPPKKIPFDVYYEWVERNARELAANGTRDKMRKDKTRCPVNARFAL